MMNPTSPCPFCGTNTPMNIGAGKKLPGSICPACDGFHAPLARRVLSPLSTFTLQYDGSVSSADHGTGESSSWKPSDPGWAEQVSAFGVDPEAVRARLAERSAR